MKGMHEMTVSKVGLYILTFFKDILPSFLADNFEIRKTKRSQIAGLAVGAVTLLGVILGALAGVLLRSLALPMLLGVGLGIILVITFYNGTILLYLLVHFFTY